MASGNQGGNDAGKPSMTVFQADDRRVLTNVELARIFDHTSSAGQATHVALRRRRCSRCNNIVAGQENDDEFGGDGSGCRGSSDDDDDEYDDLLGDQPGSRSGSSRHQHRHHRRHRTHGHDRGGGDNAAAGRSTSRRRRRYVPRTSTRRPGHSRSADDAAAMAAQAQDSVRTTFGVPSLKAFASLQAVKQSKAGHRRVRSASRSSASVATGEAAATPGTTTAREDGLQHRRKKKSVRWLDTPELWEPPSVKPVMEWEGGLVPRDVAHAIETVDHISHWTAGGGRVASIESKQAFGQTLLSVWHDTGRMLTVTSDVFSVWDPLSGQRLHTTPCIDKPRAFALQALVNGRVAVGAAGHTALWNIGNAAGAAPDSVIHVMHEGDDVIPLTYAVLGQRDRRYHLASGLSDGMISVYDLKTGQPVSRMPTDHAHGVRRLATVPDYADHVVASTGYADGLTGKDDPVVQLWDVRAGRRAVASFDTGDHAGDVCPLPASLAPNAVAVSCYRTGVDTTSPIHVYDWRAVSRSNRPPARLRSLAGHSRGVNVIGAVQSRDLPFLVSGSEDGSVKVWDIVNGSCVYTLTGHQSLIGDLTLLPPRRDGGGQFSLASLSMDHIVKVWTLYCL